MAIDSGVIRVTAGAAGCVQVRGILRPQRSWLGWGDVDHRIHELEASPPIEQCGDAIRVEYLGSSWLTGSVALLLEIAVPADAIVHAHADSGDIYVDGVNGPVVCSTDSGGIEVSNIGAAVRAEADSGNIRIFHVAGPVYAEADSGEIQALEVGGSIEASTDSGSIVLSQTVAASVRAEADSGDIRVRLVAGAGYNLRAQTDSGEIRVPEMSSVESRGNDVAGQIRGGGPPVDLEVDSGDIEVE